MQKKVLLLLSFITLYISSIAQDLTINFLGRYTDGNEGACEITAYNKEAKKIYLTNAYTNTLDIIDVKDLSSPVKERSIDISQWGAGVNSVVNIGTSHIALAVESDPKQEPGKVVILDTAGVYTSHVIVGALPDMITITPDGNKILVANEGEPNDSYTVDPQGSISIIDISGGLLGLDSSDVTTLDFLAAPVSIPGSVHKPGTTWAQDLEPEYISVSEDGTRAAVTCQEANVLILIDLTADSILAYKGLGFKDHSLTQNALDASNKDGGINMQAWNVKGVYQPDAITSITHNGSIYWLTANEGDGRDYDAYSSETRVEDLQLDPQVYDSTIALEENLGRLKTFTPDVLGDSNGDGLVEQIYSYGARSFSIWDEQGELVWDSGSEIENYMATNWSTFFNCNDGKASKMDSRSDDKGAEPEAITTGKINILGKQLVFVGLERQGGVLVYKMTDPTNLELQAYLETFDTTTGTSVDVGPEGLLYIEDSHLGTSLLIVSNEVSGTASIYQIDDITATADIEKNSFRVYPNPTKNKLNIHQLSNLQAYQAVVYDLGGSRVLYQTLDTDDPQIDISTLSKGFYIISLLGKGGTPLFSTGVNKL